MNLRLLSGGALTALAVAAGTTYLHPGIEIVEPRFADRESTSLSAPATYDIDVAHAQINFEIKHLGLSVTAGRFNKFKGVVHEDVSDLTKSTVEFSAEIDSIDTAVPARDAHLKTADFFDAKKWPTLSFKSTKVEKRGDGYVVTGDLTMKDKTKSVSIPFKHYGPLKMTVGDMSTRVGVIAEPIVIKRSDFGVGGQFKLPDGTEGASDDVTIRISFEAILRKDGGNR